MKAEVVGVLVAVDGTTPLALAPGQPPTLPSGPLDNGRPSLQRSTRHWIVEQTGLDPGYLEQLYTFADALRRTEERVLSVSYLGLMPAPTTRDGWVGWYDLFPWEDRRVEQELPPSIVDGLARWSHDDDARTNRADITFGLHAHPWLPEMVLQRYELLYEAGLIPEAPQYQQALAPGAAMAGDHRRILATGLARLRAKLSYRPVAFELMPEQFTLSGLQRCVEAIIGHTVHTQNFRRTVEQQNLVEETGQMMSSSRGRPAKCVRFRRDVLQERLAAGTKLPVPRSR